MTSCPQLKLFHNPQSRSSCIRILLEELELPCAIELVDFKNKPEALLAANPLGKVPTLLADDAVVSEQIAIVQFLAELAPGKNLSPAVGDPLRGPYLRALALYGTHAQTQDTSDKLSVNHGFSHKPHIPPHRHSTQTASHVEDRL